MCVVMYCVAIYFTELAIDLNDHEGIEDIRVHWGTVEDSVLSLYMAITGGDDWRNFIDVFTLAPDYYWSACLIFTAYVAFAVMVLLNLVTGVFVDGAQRII